MACSLLTIMKFGLDESTRRGSLKVAVYQFGGLHVYSTNNDYHGC